MGDEGPREKVEQMGPTGRMARGGGIRLRAQPPETTAARVRRKKNSRRRGWAEKTDRVPRAAEAKPHRAGRGVGEEEGLAHAGCRRDEALHARGGREGRAGPGSTNGGKWALAGKKVCRPRGPFGGGHAAEQRVQSGRSSVAVCAGGAVLQVRHDGCLRQSEAVEQSRFAQKAGAGPSE